MRNLSSVSIEVTVLSDVAWKRLMILAFTSTAFVNWVSDHVQSGRHSTFNPYLAFLFMAL